MSRQRFIFESPMGPLYGEASAHGLTHLNFSPLAGAAPTGDLHHITKALSRYFDGELRALDDCPVDATGTPFRQTVWVALRTIPAGQTTTYGALATIIGTPGGARAVGLANGANPVSIVVPCHRVIGANGALTGYAGGLERKRWLLHHEGVAGFLVP